ncbi:hypothetical protein R1sor_005565 [Riccia sorocarpa]|uniref:Uncharacterized protein n=1 Tax=Riccia sorocarpa TaxID=122646 RepID=A0ABD3HNG6_9MARC
MEDSAPILDSQDAVGIASSLLRPTAPTVPNPNRLHSHEFPAVHPPMAYQYALHPSWMYCCSLVLCGPPYTKAYEGGAKTAELSHSKAEADPVNDKSSSGRVVNPFIASISPLQAERTEALPC